MDPRLRYFVERSRRCTLSAIVSLTYAAGFGIVDEPILSIFIGVDLRPAGRKCLCALAFVLIKDDILKVFREQNVLRLNRQGKHSDKQPDDGYVSAAE